MVLGVSHGAGHMRLGTPQPALGIAAMGFVLPRGGRGMLAALREEV